MIVLKLRKLQSLVEHAQQRLIQTIKCKESRYVVHNWIIYARLSVFDNYRDTIIIVIKVTIYCDSDSSTIAQLYPN